MKADPVFVDALERFLAGAQAMIDEQFVEFEPQRQPRLRVDPGGRRYLRIVLTRGDGGNRSAWAFIDTTNGDLLRPETWKGPAKTARGNIFDAAGGLAHVSWTGPHYLDAIPT